MTQHKKILIVEDEAPQLKALRDKMKNEGFSVITAVNGVEGLRLAEEESPDIILLDIVMPQMDGLTMLHSLRDSEWGKHIPIIILTNLSEAATALEGEEVEDYLVKANWKMSELVDRIREVLAK